MKKSNTIFMLIVILILFILIITAIIFYMNQTASQNKVPATQEENQETTEIKQKYESNEFSLVTLTTESLVNIYFEDYKDKMLYHPEQAYYLLDEAYRQKKFGGLEAFETYLNQNKTKLTQMKLNQFLINEYGDYDEYVCMDQYHQYYIFEVTAVMEYTVRLDTYTVDSAQFVETYNKSSVQEKVILNIQKVINALNNNGYHYVYSKLDATFVQEQYPQEADFEKFAKNHFFEQNSVTFDQFFNEGDIYIYNLTITNTENEAQQRKLMIIMKLQNESDFVMSFSFEE